MRPALRAGIGSALFFLVAPGIVAGLVPLWLTGWRMQEPLLRLGIVRVPGAFMVLAGLGCLVECFSRFALAGQGTPAPVAPPTQLVVSGQYRYVRNPMYVAILIIVVGQSLLLGNAVLLEYAIVLWLLFHLWVVFYEEPRLGFRFGASYRAYRQKVRRWWPRLRPWDA